MNKLEGPKEADGKIHRTSITSISYREVVYQALCREITLSLSYCYE